MAFRSAEGTDDATRDDLERAIDLAFGRLIGDPLEPDRLQYQLDEALFGLLEGLARAVIGADGRAAPSAEVRRWMAEVIDESGLVDELEVMIRAELVAGLGRLLETAPPAVRERALARLVVAAPTGEAAWSPGGTLRAVPT